MLLVCLLGAVGLQFVSFGSQPVATKPVDLTDMLPRKEQGWEVEDMPLAETEGVREAVAERLNYDSYVYRKYSRGADVITVYIAHWGPGRMDTRLVASHTPDRCWQENGWQCTNTGFTLPLEFGDVVTKPGQKRTFEYTANQNVEYVYYWQLVGDGVYDFGSRINSHPDPVKYARDFVLQLREGKPEQYFIRISSNIPHNRWSREPLFQELVRSMAPIGLLKPAEQPAS